MSFSQRTENLCALLKSCKRFADVGCDHGYFSQYMLVNNMCEQLFFCDISAGSLQKARKLLGKYVDEGRATAVLGDGLKAIDAVCDEVIIAGMGGVEICSIIERSYVPQRFVFQPMKNAEKLRTLLVERGCGIERDYTFFADGKYYDVIVGTATGATDEYTPDEIALGRDNLRAPTEEFIGFARSQQSKLKNYCKREMSDASRAEISARIELLGRVVK